MCDDILAGDPNCTGLEVELANDCFIPERLSLAMGGGRGVDVEMAVMSSPSPQPIGPHSASSSSSPARLTQAKDKLMALRSLVTQTHGGMLA